MKAYYIKKNFAELQKSNNEQYRNKIYHFVAYFVS